MASVTYYGVFSSMNLVVASNTIKQQWIKCRYNPRYKMCMDIEMRNIDRIGLECGIKTEKTPDFSNIRLCYRRSEFQEDLKKTKQFLRNKEKMRLRVKLRAGRSRKPDIV